METPKVNGVSGSFTTLFPTRSQDYFICRPSTSETRKPALPTEGNANSSRIFKGRNNGKSVHCPDYRHAGTGLTGVSTTKLFHILHQ
ncbi:hypothetical protein CHS0354_013870 [Potamilus streckersoni]|uniref:Uncharacterized protein n=1 Tax=Potamilus streckersoni TaxID=2493646 RepID=A0AAE0TBC8_9BIVA|nr:hypothetical protein CHS0354_013870 [Potamilus streckersoni]